MTTDSYRNIEKLESDLWEAADNLRHFIEQEGGDTAKRVVFCGRGARAAGTCG